MSKSRSLSLGNCAQSFSFGPSSGGTVDHSSLGFAAFVEEAARRFNY